MTQRIAPNNNLPATHFIEVWKDSSEKVHNSDVEDVFYLTSCLFGTKELCFKTVAIFRIRENKLPTKHDFNA